MKEEKDNSFHKKLSWFPQLEIISLSFKFPYDVIL